MNWSSYRSRLWLQRIIIILIAGTLLGLVVVNIINDRKEQQEEQKQNQQINVSLINEDDIQERERDTDNDGVPDWEERLWGLNPERADSDGDGVSDAQYIQYKKNIQERRELGIENIEDDLSESQKLGRSLYTALLAIRESGSELTKEDQEKITDNIANYISELNIGRTLYVREDLNLVENTQELSYAYRDELVKLFEDNPIESRDIELLTDAVENSAAYATRITETRTRYETIETTLAEMSVPYAIGGRHTELLNSIAQMTGGLTNLDSEEEDDLVSLAMLVQLDDIFTKITEAIDNIYRYFQIIENEGVFDDPIT